MKMRFFLGVVMVFTQFAVALAQDASTVLQKYFREKYSNNLEQFKDKTSYTISSSYTDDFSKITYVYLQQMYKGIPIYNAVNSVAIKNGVVVSENSRFVDFPRKKVNAEHAVLTSDDALNRVLQHLEIVGGNKAQLKEFNESTKRYVYYANNYANSDIAIQLYYTIVDDILKLCWDVSFEMKSQSHWWNTRVDAIDGTILEKNDYTAHCDFDTDNDAPPPPPPASTQGYNVFHFPIESPNFGNRLLLNTLYDSVASPYDWLDTNGVLGDDFVITRGNNVYAYEDANNDNLPGYSPTANAQGFNFPYSAAVTPLTNQDAALANLFYANNKIHDLTYVAGGFTEQAGNFQHNNYGRGGLGNDAVNAEGFDGSGTNNANFSTPVDGIKPRMQMYLWTGSGAQCSSLTTSSSPFNYTVGTAQFAVNASVTATVILAVDGTAPVNDACQTLTNNVAGKIVIIDRGTCNFTNKVLAAQTAGAVGVIIANNTAGVSTMAGTNASITIPCLMISQADGNTLKAAVAGGTVTATMNTCIPYDIDANFDNGVIAHEYGHGVSNRLTGGPANASCLTNAEQGGEGWSDWLALISTMKATDSANQSRGIGTYVNGQTATGGGIRRYPYSYNMSINPQTYGDLATSTTVHQRGEIWCDAIWDMTWLIVNSAGFSTNVHNVNAGNNIAMRLVLEGMKLQPCNPGMIDARNAILTADALLYNNAHRCLIWQAFARRGMGFGASQGSGNTVGDETVSFSLPYYCLSPVALPTANFNTTTTTVSCGTVVSFNDLSSNAYDWKWYFGDGDTSTLQTPTHTYNSSGLYTVRLVVSNPLGSDSMIKTAYVNVTPNFSASLNIVSDTVCKGDTAVIIATPSGSTNIVYTVNAIPFAPVTTTGTSVSLTDDSYSASLPIGFTFNFYGNNYTTFQICSNGYLTFTSGQSTTQPYGQILPNASSIKNMIALAWNDWNPQNAGSSITYYTTGTAPNRKLVVSFNTSHFGGTAYPFVAQAILYETTNSIEIHTTTHPNIAPYDNTATTTQGVQNTLGNKATTTAGRNGALTGLYSNDAKRFSPLINYNFNWLPVGNNNDTFKVTPISTSNYTVVVDDGSTCKETFVSDTIEVDDPIVSLSYNAPVYTLDTLKINISSSNAVTAYTTLGPNSISSNNQNVLIPNVTSAQHSGTYTTTIQDALGCLKTDSISVFVTASPVVKLKALLSGAYNTSTLLMNDDLRQQSILPLTEPYSVQPYSSTFIHVNGGNEQTNSTVLSTTGNNAIVDWVFIQLRNKLDSTIVVATQSALIQRDGDVVNPRDGVSPLVFKNLALNNYFITLKHRNHLGVMTANAIGLNEQSAIVDFTNTNTAVYTKPNPYNNAAYTGAQMNVGGLRALYTGNSNIEAVSGANKWVRYNGSGNDRISILALSGTSGFLNGYHKEDINLDGSVKYNGFNNDRVLLLQTINANINGILYEQTPN